MKKENTIRNFLRITKAKFFLFLFFGIAVHAIPNSLRCFEKLPGSSYCISYFAHPFRIPMIISQNANILSVQDWLQILSLGLASLIANLIIVYILISLILLAYRRIRKK
tara:strand:+ start:12290 stop:12616 length:327 start_codon:yes stop_codon:yes gene_type:complete